MKSSDAVQSLGALAQASRLEIFRLLVKRGPEGYTPSDLIQKLDIPAPTLSFHLKELTGCGLLRATQQGRYIRYAVRPEAFAELAALVEALPGASARKSGARAVGPRSARRARGVPRAAGGEEQLSIFGD